MPPSADLPFGFSPGAGIPDDLAAKIPLFAELRKLLAADGPVNWELARQLAIASVGAAESVPGDETADVVRIADVWLDAVTALPTGVRTVEAWPRPLGRGDAARLEDALRPGRGPGGRRDAGRAARGGA